MINEDFKRITDKYIEEEMRKIQDKYVNVDRNWFTKDMVFELHKSV